MITRATQQRRLTKDGQRRKRGLYQEDIHPPRLHINVCVSETVHAGLSGIAAAEGWTISRAAAEILAGYFDGDQS